MKESQSPVIQFVIQALADDFESLDTLVNYNAAPGMPAFSETDVLRALVGLVNGGSVRSYVYSESEQKYIPAEFSPDYPKKYWFGLVREKA